MKCLNFCRSVIDKYFELVMCYNIKIHIYCPSVILHVLFSFETLQTASRPNCADSAAGDGACNESYLEIKVTHKL